MKKASTILILCLFLIGIVAVKPMPAVANPYNDEPPSIEIQYPVQDGVYRFNAPFIARVYVSGGYAPIEEKVTSLSYSLDGKPDVALEKNFGYNLWMFVSDVLNGLSDGKHTLFVHGQTTLSNQGENLRISSFNSTVSFSVDTQSPPSDTTASQIKVLAPENNTTHMLGFVLNYWTSKPMVWARFNLNNRENITINGNLTGPIYPQQNGNATYTLTMYYADMEGVVVASEPVTFKVGLYPPNATPILPDWSKIPFPGPWSTPTPTPTSPILSPNMLFILVTAISIVAIVTVTFFAHRKRLIKKQSTSKSRNETV